MPNVILINAAMNAGLFFTVIAGKDMKKEVNVPFDYQVITKCDCRPCHKYIFPVSVPSLQFNYQTKNNMNIFFP